MLLATTQYGCKSLEENKAVDQLELAEPQRSDTVCFGQLACILILDLRTHCVPAVEFQTLAWLNLKIEQQKIIFS